MSKMTLTSERAQFAKIDRHSNRYLMNILKRAVPCDHFTPISS